MPRKKKEETTPVVLKESEILQEIDRLYPLHPGQLILEDQVFKQKKKRIFAQCGRNWGKSIWIGRTTIKFACLNKGSHCYIICPNKVQAREIYWDSGMILSMIPQDMIAVNFLGKDETIKTELRIRLKNGSFIKILGADDPDSLRGIKPHFCAYDEYRDFKGEVYWNMEANLVGKDATLLIGSTPPDVLGAYSELRNHFLKEVLTKESEYFYLELPTEQNPHINKKTLMDIKRRLIAHGQIRVWEREYMAKFIPGGASSVFPMFAEKREGIVKPSFLVDELVKNEREALEFYCSFDPATSSVFAVLFAAVNKYTGQFYNLDEIYERDRMRTGSLDIWKRATEIKRKYCKNLEKWHNVYDEHEAWFQRDIERAEILLPDESLDPTSKQSKNKEEDLGLIKDLMLLDNRYFISENCKYFIEEIESYTTDKSGKLIKKKDHQIDNERYIIHHSGFTLNEQPDYEGYEKKLEKSNMLPPGFDEFIRNKRKQEDWTQDLDESTVIFDDSVIYLEDLDHVQDLF